MRNIVIADTSVLIALDKLDLFLLLSFRYKKVLVTPTVAKEFGKPLPEWIEIVEPTNETETERLKQILDAGEATAIALAEETFDCDIVLDDRKARRVAVRLGLEVFGTVALLERGYDDGDISTDRDVAEELKVVGFHINGYLEKYLRAKMTV